MKNIKRWAIVTVTALTTAVVGFTTFASAELIRVRMEAPPPRVEVIPNPPAAQVRVIPGHWEFVGGERVWIQTRHIETRAEWVPGHWERDGGDWIWIDGYWD